MATKNFTQFSTATPLTTSDYIVGYNAAGTTEIKTQIQNIVNLVGETDSQTLSFNEADKNLTISSGNTVSLSSLSEDTDILPTVTNYLSTSNVLINSLNVLSNLSATSKLSLNTVNVSAVPQIYFNEYFGNGTGSIFTHDSSRTQASPAAPKWGQMHFGLNIVPNATGSNKALIDYTKGGASFTIENMWVTPTVNQPLAEFYTNITDLCANKTVRGFGVIGNQLSADLGFNTSVYPLQIAPAKGSLNGWYGQDATYYPLNVNYEVTNATAELARFNNPDSNANASAAIYLGVQNESYKTILLAKRNEFYIRNFTAGRTAFYLDPTGILLGSTVANAKAQAPVHAADSMLVSGNLSATNVVYASGGNSNQWNTAYSAITGTTQLYTYYVSPSGNNSNPGTEALPLSTVNRAVQLAGNNDLRVILTSGTFVNQQIDLSNLRSLEVIGDQNGRTIIRNGTTFSDWTLHSGSVYKTTASPEITSTGNAYSPSTLTFYQLDTTVSNISAIDSLPPQHGRSYRLQHAPITRSSSLNDILTGSNGRWWFESDQLYFKTYDGTAATGKSLHVSHPSLSGSFIYNGNGSISKVTVSNIEIVGANIGIDLSYVRQADIARAIVFGTTVYGVYGMNSGAVNIRNCEFAYTGDDSINFKGDQNNIPVTNFQNRDINVYDCWVHDSIDKGLVAHERTTINVYGGLFEYNTLAGIMAFTGGEIFMNGVTTRGHATQGTEITGSISASEGGVGTIIQALNCVSLQDRIGYRVNPSTDSSKTKLDLVNCTIDAPTLAGIYTTGQSTTNHKLNATGINLTTSGQLITTTTNASATVNFQNATVTRSSTPEGNVTAPVGTIARVTSGGLNTTLYVKVSGNLGDNTGWRSIVTQ